MHLAASLAVSYRSEYSGIFQSVSASPVESYAGLTGMHCAGAR